MKNVEPKFMGVEQAEAYSGISKWSWRRKAYSGEISSYKIGKRLILSKDEIDRVLAAGYRPALAIAGQGEK
jgi:hypothetical protein